MGQTADDVRAALAALADPGIAVGSARYFKTGVGQYGAGDVFLGVKVPAVRRVVRQFRGLPFDQVDALLDDAEHEHRLAAVLLLVAAYPGASAEVVDRYLAAVRRGRVNNWDLVDASSEFILGHGCSTAIVPCCSNSRHPPRSGSGGWRCLPPSTFSNTATRRPRSSWLRGCSAIAKT